jgi:uncharacterized protein
MITEELLPCLQGIVPATIVTTTKDLMPNASIISQVFPVDDTHVAISNQFFSKTFRNLQENPYAQVQVQHPESFIPYLLNIKLVRIETSGELFESMEMQLEAIASMTGMSDVFKLQSCYVFEILSIDDFKHAIKWN